MLSGEDSVTAPDKTSGAGNAKMYACPSVCVCVIDERLDRSERMEQTEPAFQLSADIQYMYVIAFSIFTGV